jgi:predicted amino acid racemase
MYPQLEIDLNKLRQNAREVIRRCERYGIAVCGVVKGYWSDPVLAKTYLDAGAKQLGTSRLSQIRRMREAGLETEYLLLRVPQMCELDDVAALADMSLQSDRSTLQALNHACEKQDKVHKVIVMADLGDLREGFWDKDEMVDTCVFVDRSLHNLHLSGIGVNLGCYGAIQPTPEKMTDLLNIAKRIESRIGRPLELISGGATSTFTLVHWNTIPAGINHLRIGEGVSLAYDLPYIWGIKDMDYLHRDAFTLKAQVVEVRTKPSHPQGKFCIDAFGDLPTYEDRGMRKRALCAIGRADAGVVEKLAPRMKGIEVLGGSSDHLILDIEDCPRTLMPGDVLEFDICYANIVNLTVSPDVEKVYVDGERDV